MKRQFYSNCILRVTLMLTICYLFCMGQSVKAQAAEEIPAPKSLTVVTSKNGEMIASWNDVDVNLSFLDSNDSVNVRYEIEVLDSDDWPYYSGIIYENSTSFMPNEPMATHKFRVRAIAYYTIYDRDDNYQDNGTLESKWTTKKFKTGLTAPSYVYVYKESLTELEVSFPTAKGYGYQIYRKAEGESKFKRIKKVSKADSTYGYYYDKKLTPGVTYYYKVRLWDKDNDKVGPFSEITSGRTVPYYTYIDVKPNTVSSLSITWDRGESEATGYKIYRSEKKDSGFKKVKTINKISTTKYTDKGLTEGKTYYYKVKVYVKTDNGIVYSDDSEVVGCKVQMGPPKISKFKAQSISKMKITIKPVEGADGYKLYRSTSYDSGYKCIKTFEAGDDLSYIKTGQKHGKEYFYKTKSFKYKEDGSKVFSPFSDVVSHYQDYYGYYDEDYTSKCMRAFGKDHRVDFSSAKQAEKNMTTIKVKVWDINSKGKKYSTTRSMKVLKGLAPTIKRIFKEIYEGDEKFPIHSLGCYSWRGDTSSSEHCEGMAIDINPEENYCVYNDGTIDNGKYWKPGKDPYSIPKDGDVVNIMRKYGFSWGMWSYKKDYMHFSYFGG